MGSLNMREIPLVIILHVLDNVNSFQCQDKNPALCANADCDNKLNRLLCPETCDVCKKLTNFEASCVDKGQFCDVVDCSIAASRLVCAKTCG